MNTTRILYGEYSLAHWVKLLLSQEIVLPEYQRHFVWSQRKSLNLISSLKEGLFVPPITIAQYLPVDKNSTSLINNQSNLILDGQQRLTSILLFYLDIWPSPKERQTDKEIYNSDNDNDNDNDNNEEFEDLNETSTSTIKFEPWILKNIQGAFAKSRNIIELKATLKYDKNYTSYKGNLNQDNQKIYDEIMNQEPFLTDIYTNTFLGFSYIQTQLNDEKNKKKFFSSIFRTINVSASPLTNLESREALYWIDADKVPFLKPEAMNIFTVSGKVYDFVRCLAFTSEFNKMIGPSIITSKPVAKSYGNRSKPYEEYFELYVNNIINSNDNNDIKFTKYSEDHKIRIPDLENAIKLIYSTSKDFSNIFEADFLFFGLTYWIVFQGKKLKAIDGNDKNTILKTLDDLKIRAEKEFGKSPNRIGAIRKRIYDSIRHLKGYME